MTAEPITISFQGLDELERVSVELLKIGAAFPVWLFEGQMGAGKTTLIKALCQQLGVKSHIQSPTFALVNEYEAAEKLIYHFDFYRINDETEALDMGVEEYFDSGDYCFVEWPAKIESLWPQNYLHLHLRADETGGRTLEITKV